MTQPSGIDVQAIRRRAHELWLRRGCPTGTPDLDWQQAERELRAEAHGETPPAAADSRANGPRSAGEPLPPRPRAPRSLVTRAAHAPAARLLAALVPEASTERAVANVDRAPWRR
jgi:hypothetical protein